MHELGAVLLLVGLLTAYWLIGWCKDERKRQIARQKKSASKPVRYPFDRRA
jgi:hypothetical protein